MNPALINARDPSVPYPFPHADRRNRYPSSASSWLPPSRGRKWNHPRKSPVAASIAAQKP